MVPFSITPGPGPLVAAALHDGHDVHPDTLPHLAIDEATRLREEDPLTATFVTVAPTQIVGHRSRFEVDLNRPPEQAVYRTPQDAWGLQVWQDTVPTDAIERSMGIYHTFYAAVEDLLETMIRANGAVVVFDVHSYNHRRGGPGSPSTDPESNPEVNVGTGTLDRARWGALVDGFMTDLCSGARHAGLDDLDVRENVKFRGGYFPRWIHDRFGSAACVLAIEFKKTFMDEWRGAHDPAHLRRLREALAHTVPGVLDAYAAITGRP